MDNFISKRPQCPVKDIYGNLLMFVVRCYAARLKTVCSGMLYRFEAKIPLGLIYRKPVTYKSKVSSLFKMQFLGFALTQTRQTLEHILQHWISTIVLCSKNLTQHLKFLQYTTYVLITLLFRSSLGYTL